MSSDSEDDCYGNIALKLQTLKKTYETATKTTDVLSPEPSKTANSTITVEDYIPKNNPVSTADVSIVESEGEEISLDTIIAQNTKKKSRNPKRSAAISVDNIIGGGKKRRTTRNSKKSANETLPVPPLETTQRGRGKKGESTSDLNTEVPEQRGRGRGKRGRTPRRGRGRGRSIPDFFEELARAITMSEMDSILTQTRSNSNQPRSNSNQTGSSASQYPTYSIGNTHDYPDQSENQSLFTKKPEEIVLSEEEAEINDSFENEELSVKVYWRSSEVHKFNIRQYQKLSQIFNFFAEREKVSQEKLLFTYNDKILKISDTPDSIDYSIAKFIEGGIVNQNVSELMKKDEINAQKKGLKIKFQCQNVKKPFETVIQPEEKLSVAMVMCAEHFEKPLEKMRFYFDGDLISPKLTPEELELEGGECIDVKIIS